MPDPHTQNSDQAMFASTVERVIEWGQCDPAGIVFFPRYYEMCDAATATLLARALGESKAAFSARYGIVGVPLVAQEARFHAPCSHGDAITIGSRVTRVGGSSITIAHRITRGETLAVDVTETRVWVARRSTAAHDIGAASIPEIVSAQLRSSKP